jgi:hypothetical protein
MRVCACAYLISPSSRISSCTRGSGGVEASKRTCLAADRCACARHTEHGSAARAIAHWNTSCTTSRQHAMPASPTVTSTFMRAHAVLLSYPSSPARACKRTKPRVTHDASARRTTALVDHCRKLEAVRIRSSERASQVYPQNQPSPTFTHTQIHTHAHTNTHTDTYTHSRSARAGTPDMPATRLVAMPRRFSSARTLPAPSCPSRCDAYSSGLLW